MYPDTKSRRDDTWLTAEFGTRGGIVSCVTKMTSLRDLKSMRFNKTIQMKKNSLLFMAILLKINVFAQDIVFSQMQPNSALLNPAWVINRSHPVQAAAQYRNQWSPILQGAAYRTIAVSADALVQHRKNWWGVGTQWYQDQSGSAHFTQTQGSIYGLYSKLMGNSASYKGKERWKHYLTLGASVGFQQHRVDESKLRWVEQYEDKGVFNPSVLAPIFLEGNGKTAMDVHVGLLWHANNALHDGFELGLSLFHLNTPNLSLVENGNAVLSRRLAIHGSKYHPIGNGTFRMKYHFAHLSQGTARQTVLGAQIATAFPSKNLVFGWGNAVRISRSPNFVLTDALISTINIDYQDYTFVLNYDWNLSALSQNRLNNAIELALIYKIKK